MLTNVINLIAAVIISQSGFPISQVTDQPALFLKNMSVSQGLYDDKIVVEWENTGNQLYSVMRSNYKKKDFKVITQTDDTRFEDVDVEKGVKYWYKIVPSAEKAVDEKLLIKDKEYNSFPEEAFTEPGVNKSDLNDSAAEKKDSEIPSMPPLRYSGCTAIGEVQDLKLNDLLKLKKAKLQLPSDPEKKKTQNRQLEYLKKEYMHSVKLSLFMTLARPYIDKGELKIITGCDKFEIKKKLKQTVFYDKNYTSMTIFQSGKFINILTDSKDLELSSILLNNSDLYCIPDGKTFIVDKTGITRLVNLYNAVGLSTGYLKNDIEWKSRTIMLATAREDLRKKLQKASSKSSD